MERTSYETYCDNRRVAQQFRVLQDSEILPHGRILRNGKTLINFSSNDYLGLAYHPALIAKSKEYAEKYGAGATASRLVCGNNPLYNVLEKKLAQGKGTESALILNCGYQANMTVLAALADGEVTHKPVILADRLCHNSLLQGALLSKARLIRYHHNDYAHLESLLKKHSEDNAHIIIVTESVFGMDGDCAALEALTRLSENYRSMLYVDEAHATGLYGAHGFGFCSHYPGKIDIAMGTFGKALGSFGAYIGCSAVIRDYLVQRCGGLIYSTALPPSVLGSIDAALDLLPTLHKEREHLQSQSARLRQALSRQGWNCDASATHIIPLILGGEDAALKLSEALQQKGILAAAIRPPTVPRGTSRLRISVTAAHNTEDIDLLIKVLAAHSTEFAVP